MASITDDSDKWKEDVNNNIINDYDILTSTLNTIAVKDAHHDKLSERDAFNVLPEIPTPKIKREREGDGIKRVESKTYNPKSVTFTNDLMNEITSGENALGNLLFGEKVNESHDINHSMEILQKNYNYATCKKTEIIQTILDLMDKKEDNPTLNLFLFIDCAIGMDKAMAEEAAEKYPNVHINTVYLREHANDPVKQPLPTKNGSQTPLFQRGEINFYYECVPKYQKNYTLYPQWPEDKTNYVRENLLISRMNVFQGCINGDGDKEYDIKSPYCISDPKNKNMFVFEKSDCEKNTVSFKKKSNSLWNTMVNSIEKLKVYKKLKGNNKVLTIAKRFGDQGQMASEQGIGNLAWPALIRKLDKIDISYKE